MKVNKELLYDVCGICAGMASYAFTSMALNRVKLADGVLTRTGCVLIQVYAGLEIGERVKEKTKKICEKLCEEIEV